MKIAICGSLNFAEEIRKIKNQLLTKRHEALLPASLEKFSIKKSEDAREFKQNRKKYLKIKPTYMKDHFDKITSSDAILVVNLEKNGIKNYIGGNTFAEIMIAYFLNKKIFFLNPIPKDERLSFIIDEIESVKPIVINGNLDLIK